MDRQQFEDPPAEYRGVTLWMLNDRLEPDEIARQLRSFREAGWGAVITRTFDGLATEYLSEEWMSILETIVAVAGELGMKVWFQAGYMPNGIPELPERFEARVLAAREAGRGGREGDRMLLDDGEYVYAERRLPHVLELLNGEAVASYLRQAYAGTYAERFGRGFGGAIEAVWVDEPSLQPPQLPWPEALGERFRRRWGYAIADCAVSLFRRRGDFRKVRHHYWRTVVELFLEGYFAGVSAWCEAAGLKFTGHLMGEDTLCAQIAWTGSAMPAYEHMHVPGIDHLTRSLQWTHGARAAPDGVRFLLTPKQCSSAANQFGKPAALSEMYGVSSEGLTFEDRKAIAQWLAVLGINCRCLHGSFYSIRGRRKRIYAPHLSYQQPWWPDNRPVADYFARLSYALRQGTFAADVLVIHPIESAFCLFEPLRYEFSRPDLTPRDIAEMNDCLAVLSENLMKAHRGFDYGDEGTLVRLGKVAPGGLTVGSMTYRAVILPSVLTLRRTTIELLEEFMAAGGCVLSAGELPSRIDGVEDDGIAAFNDKVTKVANTPGAIAAALGEAIGTSIELRAATGSAGNVWVHERTIDGGRVFFLANTSRDETVEFEARIAGAGRLERWDLAGGAVEPAPHRTEGGAVVAPLSLPPLAAELLVLTEGEPTEAVVPAAPAVVRTVPLDRPWQIRRRDPNALTLDFCQLRKGNGEWTGEIPVIAAQEVLTEQHYVGPVTLRFSFTAETVPSRLLVVVEDAPDCRIEVNGTQVAYAGLPHYVDRSFHPTDVSGLVGEGRNVIDVSRHFEPVGRPDFEHGGRFQDLGGVELESIYLIGDFAVRGSLSARPKRARCVRCAPGFVLTDEPDAASGDLIADGYPFFAGRIGLAASVELPGAADGERAALVLPALHACLAKVTVNGTDARPITWPPYETDVTDALRQGENEIEIELTNTLRNLLGPHHRPAGEPDHVWGEADYSGGWSSEARRAFPQWYDHRHRDTDAWTDDYFFVPFGLAPGVEIRFHEIRKPRSRPRRGRRHSRGRPR